MAGDWIKVEHVTPDKPEVHRVAEILHIDPDAVVGKLVRLWVWADQQTLDGKAPIASPSLIDRVVNCPGFADALMSPDVTWLSRTSDFGDKNVSRGVTNQVGLQIPNFERHMSKTAKQRALTANRVADFRAGDRNVTPVAFQCHDGTEKSSKYVSTVVSHDKVEKEEVRKKANELMRRIFDRPPKAPATLEAGWLFAWATVSHVFSESDTASILESIQSPGIKQRGRYLRKCVQNRLESHGYTWEFAMDTARASMQNGSSPVDTSPLNS